MFRKGRSGSGLTRPSHPSSIDLGLYHGLALARRIGQVTHDTFDVKPGSLFPALHRMEEHGWLASEWGESKQAPRKVLPPHTGWSSPAFAGDSELAAHLCGYRSSSEGDVTRTYSCCALHFAIWKCQLANRSGAINSLSPHRFARGVEIARVGTIEGGVPCICRDSLRRVFSRLLHCHSWSLPTPELRIPNRRTQASIDPLKTPKPLTS